MGNNILDFGNAIGSGFEPEFLFGFQQKSDFLEINVLSHNSISAAGKQGKPSKDLRRHQPRQLLLVPHADSSLFWCIRNWIES